MANQSELMTEDGESYSTLHDECEEQDIDSIFEKSGPFARFQIFMQLSTFYLFLVAIYNFVFSFFAGNDPPWRCVSNSSSFFCRQHYNEVISSDSDLFQERCHLERSEWIYTTSVKYSFVTEFELVCGQTYLAAWISASYYVGGVIGAIITGPIADTYGRKPVLIVTTLLTACSSIGSSYVALIWQLFVLNIIRGAGNVNCYYTAIVYLSEFAAPSYRSISTNILLCGSTCSLLYIDVFAYFVRDWRLLSTYAALPIVPVLPLLFFLPESPRWLLAAGRKSHAEGIMEKIAAFNGCSLHTIRMKQNTTTANQSKYTYFDLVRNCKVLKLTLAVITVWFVLPVVYYSIALQSSSLGGNMYVSYALSTIADIPSYFFSTYLSSRFGRKKTCLPCLFISGIILGSLVLVPKSLSYRYIINITISILARFTNCIAFAGMYIWSFELFPTVLRSQGLSLCAIFDRLGMFFVPFITRLLQSVSYNLPFIIMCVLAVSGSLVGLMLPETNRKPTREKYEDIYGTSYDILPEMK